MTYYTFDDFRRNPALSDTFDPINDTLILNAAAIEIRVVTASTYTRFSYFVDGVLQTARINVSADLLDSGRSGQALIVDSGWLAFGDNTNENYFDVIGNRFWGSDVISSQYHGLQGVDTFYGGAASDLVYGNQNNDMLFGGGGADTLYGGQGNDWFDSFSLSLRTGAPDEPPLPKAQGALIYGNLGNDTVWTFNAADRIYGGQGDDWILVRSGNDTAYGGIGDDTIFGTPNLPAPDDPTIGDADILTPGDNVLYGGANNDRIHSGYGADTVYGGLGDDIITVYSHGKVGQLIMGDEGDDQIYGQAGLRADTLQGNDGNDTLYGGRLGNDLVTGGAGDDVLYGNNQPSFFAGELGNDVLYGGPGGDTMVGGYGDDTLYGGEIRVINPAVGVSKELLHGGPGDDEIYLGGSYAYNDRQVVFGAHGDDSIVGHKGLNLLAGGTGSDTIVAGWNGVDTMDGFDDAQVDFFVWNSAAAVKLDQVAVPLNGGSSPPPKTYDQVENFIAGRDNLVFKASGVFYTGATPADVIVAKDGLGQGGAKLLSATVITPNATAMVDGVRLIGSFASRAEAKAAIASQFLTSMGNRTDQTLYGFMGNTRHTVLWLVSLQQLDGDISVDAGDILGTIRVPYGFAHGDIIIY